MGLPIQSAAGGGPILGAVPPRLSLTPNCRKLVCQDRVLVGGARKLHRYVGGYLHTR